MKASKLLSSCDREKENLIVSCAVVEHNIIAALNLKLQSSG